MADKKADFTVRKIALKELIIVLNEIYGGGADFIDLHGHIKDEAKQDEVTISIPLEYMSEEAREMIEEENLSAQEQSEEATDFFLEEHIEEKPLTKEDIDNYLKNG